MAQKVKAFRNRELNRNSRFSRQAACDHAPSNGPIFVISDHRWGTRMPCRRVLF